MKNEIVSHISHESVRAIIQHKDVAKTILKEIGDNDIVIVFSAGDATQISQDVVDSLSRNGNANHV